MIQKILQIGLCRVLDPLGAMKLSWRAGQLGLKFGSTPFGLLERYIKQRVLKRKRKIYKLLTIKIQNEIHESKNYIVKPQFPSSD